MTPTQLSQATGCTLVRAASYAAALTFSMQKWGIDTPVRQAGLLGQIAHETASLTVLEENLNYSAVRLTQVWAARFPTVEAAAPCAHNPQALGNKTYGGRMGNNAPGDGYKYRGRGLLQLTGRESYLAYMLASGADCVTNPDVILQPEFAADSACWEWNQKGCNGPADAQDCKAVTRLINGGTIGYQDRMLTTAKALKALAVC